MCVSGCVTKSDRSLNIIVLSELSLTRSLPYWTGKVQGKWIWFLTHSTSSSQPQDPQQKKRELSIIQTGFLVSQTLLLKHTSTSIWLFIPPPMQSGTVNAVHMCAPALQKLHHKEELGVEIYQSGSYRFILPRFLFSSMHQPHLLSQRAFPAFYVASLWEKQAYLLSSYGCLLRVSLFADPSRFIEKTNPATAAAQRERDRERNEEGKSKEKNGEVKKKKKRKWIKKK